ncbi:MAG: tRNA pseudouridine(55) synthase TruB [Paludibacteraceae bacterium]|nr:tRNA pseudouridine(55) synthase TruB [Paludibacteraceae bacterium]
MTDYQTGSVLYFDKPLTWTSFDVVNKVRRALCKHLGTRPKNLKVGHAGTLDPMATGVLIICTGKATKRIDELQYQTKEYVATMQLGATTPSYDREHPIDRLFPFAHIDRPLIDQVVKRFIGTIEQEPPAYSAVKVNGDRAYKLARKGNDVTLKKKILTIDKLEILDFTPGTVTGPTEETIVTLEKDSAPVNDTDFRHSISATEHHQAQGFPTLTIRIVCSKGTYIRALARDIGEALGSGAYLTALRRTRIGDVRVEQCQQIDDFLLSVPPLSK